MEGLETVIIDYSITFGNKDFRIDSDFWTKEPKKNKYLKYDKIGNLIKNAQYGISVSMNEDGIGYPIYRMNEIHNMMCDLEVDKYANITFDEFKKFRLKDRDVLFNRTNSYEWVGRTGIYRNQNNQDYTFASYLVRFIPDENFINPEYLVTYLNSKYGIWDIKRRSRQSINQTNVNPEEVKEMYIPLLNKNIQNYIRECFDRAHINRIRSKEFYAQAETLLLQTLGLKDFEPRKESVNIKGFKESFLSSGRLDAEYYQPKYEDFHSLITSYKGGYNTLQNTCNLIDFNYNPKEVQIYKYIELSNIGKSGDITSCTTTTGKELPSRARRKVNANDVIISSIEGSLESCALITQEYDNALCSTGFYVINSIHINAETLLVLFKSEPMQSLLKQGCSGTILTAINKTEFQQIPIPLIELSAQKEIAQLIQESFRLKKESEQLLETAKKAVEIAIEEGEEKAMELLTDLVYSNESL